MNAKETLKMIRLHAPAETAALEAAIKPAPPNPELIRAHNSIRNLLAAMPPTVRDATDADLMEGFLDMEADQAIRDTAQVILEARTILATQK